MRLYNLVPVILAPSSILGFGNTVVCRLLESLYVQYKVFLLIKYT